MSNECLKANDGIIVDDILTRKFGGFCQISY